jgi:hypothetical protein
MDPLLAALQTDRQHLLRKSVINMHNVHIQTSAIADGYFESHSLRRADHPPYSPNLAPSDFFLSGFIKGPLTGARFADGQVLICSVKRIPSELPPEML